LGTGLWNVEVAGAVWRQIIDCREFAIQNPSFQYVAAVSAEGKATPGLKPLPIAAQKLFVEERRIAAEPGCLLEAA
jgi:hypothetical protein